MHTTWESSCQFFLQKAYVFSEDSNNITALNACKVAICGVSYDYPGRF